MREFIYTIIGMMRRMMWFAIFVTVMLISTLKNLISFDVISDYGFDQYWRNIYQFQVMDTYYKVKTPTKVYTNPILISNLNTADYQFYLGSDNVFAATGFHIPVNDMCWIAIEAYDVEIPVHGYVLEESGCLGLFGAYINKDDRFEQFLGYKEDRYKDRLMNELFSELTRNYSIYTAENKLEKAVLEEANKYENISDFINDFSGDNRKFLSNSAYYCNKKDYISILNIHEKYFSTKNYVKRLTQI